MLAGIIVIIIGLIFIILGLLIWKKQIISLLHNYHYDKVKKENKKAFCTISGIGIMIIGIGLLITGIVVSITNSSYTFIIFAIGFVIGFIMLIFAGLRYNEP